MVLEMWQLGYDHDKVTTLKGGLTRWEQLHYPLAGTSVGATASQEKGN
jgi:3-mercaptopyruvate sulfurtransferase SseA